MGKTFQTLSVRITPDVVTNLSAYTKATHTTQGQVVQKVLEYFLREHPEHQQSILSGIDTAEVPRIAQALRQMNWGDHAFSRARWTWAVTSYTSLDTIAAGSEHLQRLARFKLASAWIMLAVELRKTALLIDFPDDNEEVDQQRLGKISDQFLWKRHYMAALDCLNIAIHYLQTETNPHPVTRYNEACAWTLIAQYIAEKEFAVTPTIATDDRAQLIKLRKAALLERRKKVDAAKATANYSKISMPAASRKYLDTAMQRLRGIQSDGQRDADTIAIGNSHWLFEYAGEDADMEFMRSVNKTEFEKLISEKKETGWLLSSYKVCRGSLTIDVPPPESLEDA